MTGISVQVGPRAVGRRCAEWGLFIAREWRCVFGGVAIGLAAAVVVLGLVLTCLEAVGKLHNPAPSPAPAAFCPAGQYVESISASGWPVCVPKR